MALVSFPMPFPRVTATFTPPTFGSEDAFGNRLPIYDPADAIETECCYAPAGTNDAIENGRPYAAEVRLTLYLPKAFSADIRDAKVTLATSDPIVDSRTYKVAGSPMSYMREATPGDFSWVVQVVDFDG